MSPTTAATFRSSTTSAKPWPPFIGEGFDAPALDTLFLAAPVSFDGLLIQCAGRVVRAAPGKDTAEVHDYHDHAVPILAASLPRRMPGYRTLGFTKA